MVKASMESIQRCAVFAASVLTVFVLYIGRDLLIPLAVAILISFLLKPFVNYLSKWRVPKAVAALLATGFVAACIVGMILLLSSQVAKLNEKLPDYQHNLVEKSKDFRQYFSGFFGRVSGTVESVKKQFATTQSVTPIVAAPEAKPAAADNGMDFKTIAAAILAPFLSSLTQTGVVFVMVYFLLIDSEIVNRRLHWIGEHWRLGIPLDTIDEALKKVGSYLRTQLIINLGYGIIISVALTLIGVPNAILWGVLSGLMRYVPYIGAWIAASLPIALSIAIFPGWSRAGMVIGAYCIAEAITYALIEPLLFGHSTGVSSIGVVLATFFWGWLWGAAGLILAMPLTACLVVIGRHIPVLRTLSVLLSSDSLDSTETTDPTDPTKPVDVTSFILKMR